NPGRAVGNIPGDGAAPSYGAPGANPYAREHDGIGTQQRAFHNRNAAAKGNLRRQVYIIAHHSVMVYGCPGVYNHMFADGTTNFYNSAFHDHSAFTDGSPPGYDGGVVYNLCNLNLPG